MTGAGGAPKCAVVGWVFLDAGFTIRWRHGDPVTFVFRGQQLDHHGTAGVLDTIAVPAAGWTDLGEVRQVGQRWWQRRRPSPITRMTRRGTDVARSRDDESRISAAP
ncbi:MAG: hypothetical protein M3R63_10650 [Actinomycetota bacterium]|nr:hypothetical protein [Actinomycetota bacterium]